MFCMCGKDPWMRKVFFRKPKCPAISRIGVAKEATEDGTARRQAGMFACLKLCLCGTCMWSLASSLYVVIGQQCAAVQAEIYRVRSF